MRSYGSLCVLIGPYPSLWFLMGPYKALCNLKDFKIVLVGLLGSL